MTLAVHLQVWSFGWQKLSVQTAFMVNFNALGSLAPATAQRDAFEQHGVTPPLPKAAARTLPPSGSHRCHERTPTSCTRISIADGLDMSDRPPAVAELVSQLFVGVQAATPPS